MICISEAELMSQLKAGTYFHAASQAITVLLVLSWVRCRVHCRYDTHQG